MVITDTLSDELFEKFGDYVERELGIKMPPAKKTMLTGRLMKRLRHHKISTFKEYYDYVFSEAGKKSELSFLMDVVTTNKTDFYREKEHFQTLIDMIVPEMRARYGERLRFWSAPCSRGHEPYTMAIELAEYALKHRPFDFWILGTDLNSGVLDIGRQGVYPHRAIEPVPFPLRKKYLRRGVVNGDEMVQVVKPLRNRVSWHRMNFMDEKYDVREKFHAVFCRNMLIYFNKETQEAVVNKIARHMVPGGYLFMGHSESLTGLNVVVQQVKGTLYQLPG